MRKILSEGDVSDIADADMKIERIMDEAEKIVAEEGFHHVAGVYYANAYDATTQRMWLAEKTVNERIRQMKQQESADSSNDRARVA